MKNKSMADQLAEMQNNLTALDKILKTPEDTKVVKSVVVNYTDGTSQEFASVEAKVEHRKRKTCTQYEDKLGKKCVIGGVTYQSVSAASRALNIYKGGVTSRIKSTLFPDWNYVL